jgi:hypothetical protein
MYPHARSTSLNLALSALDDAIAGKA